MWFRRAQRNLGHVANNYLTKKFVNTSKFWTTAGLSPSLHEVRNFGKGSKKKNCNRPKLAERALYFEVPNRFRVNIDEPCPIFKSFEFFNKIIFEYIFNKRKHDKYSLHVTRATPTDFVSLMS
jgi:hypothetical protein